MAVPPDSQLARCREVPQCPPSRNGGAADHGAREATEGGVLSRSGVRGIVRTPCSPLRWYRRPARATTSGRRWSKQRRDDVGATGGRRVPHPGHQRRGRPPAGAHHGSGRLGEPPRRPATALRTFPVRHPPLEAGRRGRAWRGGGEATRRSWVVTLAGRASDARLPMLCGSSPTWRA